MEHTYTKKKNHYLFEIQVLLAALYFYLQYLETLPH